MTRIITDGAEMGDVLFWANPDGYSVIDGSTKRSGNYSYHLTKWGHYFLIGDLTAFYFRFAVMLTSVSCVLFYFRHSTTVLGDIYWDASTSKISARVNWSIVGTSTRTFSYSTWYLIESYYNVSDTGNFNMRFDGDQEITYSGDTKPGSDTHIDNIMDGFSENWHFYVDDIAVNDTNGTVDNSWCGDGHIEKITPSGSGVQNEFLNSGSVSGSANYLYVDEYPNDGDTTYVYCSGSNTGFQDQYAMSNISLTGRVITRIYAESRAKKTLGQPLSIKIGYLPSGGTDQLSGSSALSLTYGRIVGTDTIVNPVTSASWTESDINALEYVIETV